MTAAPLSTYDALCRGVLLFPEDDVQRLALADELTEMEGAVICSACKGTGRRSVLGVNRPVVDENGNSIKCFICKGAKRVSNGNAERAELYRVGVELAHHRPIGVISEPINDPWGGSSERGVDHVIVDHKWSDETLRLRARERELIEFGRTAGWWDIKGIPTGHGNTPTGCGENAPICWWYRPDLDGELLRIEAAVRRGSIDEIRLPAAAFTEELARAVWGRFPITKCVLGGIPQVQIEDLTWVNGPTIGGSRVPIPMPVFSILCETGLRHPTREAALAALSSACVWWGRSLAGLTDSP